MVLVPIQRRDFLRLLGGAAVAPSLLWPLAARAQHAGKTYRIGFLANDPTIPTQAAGKAFLEGLREHGFVEGKNIVIERRFAQGGFDRSSELAAELVGLDVSLIVASGQNNAVAMKQATKTIPIVMVNVFDPIGMGIVRSLASPGGNITGLTSHVSAEMVGKRLQLLKEAVPQISRLAVLRNPGFVTDQTHWDALARAAPALNVKPIAVTVREPRDLEVAFAAIRRERPDALFCSNNPQTLMFRQPIVEFALKEQLPAMYPFTELAEVGGLMSYGASRSDLFRSAATYAAKILNGAKAGDLPVEQPTKFEFVINLKTAKALGLDVPLHLQQLADEVIE